LAAVSTREHLPILGQRIAMACHKCLRREFLDGPDARWVCPEHGKAATYRQKNHKYFGRPT
jgi:hypothetical protein